MNVFLETYIIVLYHVKEFFNVTEVNIFQWRYVHSWKLKSEESLRANKIKSILSDVIVPNEPTNVLLPSQFHSGLTFFSSFYMQVVVVKKILYFPLIFRYIYLKWNMLCTWLLRNFYQESVNHSWVLTRCRDGSCESWLQAPVQDTSKIITFNQTSRNVITVLFFTHTFGLTFDAIVWMATFFTTIWSLKAKGAIWKKKIEHIFKCNSSIYACIYIYSIQFQFSRLR